MYYICGKYDVNIKNKSFIRIAANISLIYILCQYLPLINYDIAILINLKDDKFREIDIQVIAVRSLTIRRGAVKKFRPLTTSSDDLNVHTAYTHCQTRLLTE